MTKKYSQISGYCLYCCCWLLSINTAYSQEALMVHGRDGSCPVSTALNNIQRITFSDDNMSVKPFDGDVAVYALDDIAKLTFGDMIITNVANPPATGFDVVVYVTPAGEIVVESPVGIQSLTLFNVDGKILRVAAVETRHATSLQTTVNASTLPTGIYILQIKTQQGIVARKIIKK